MTGSVEPKHDSPVPVSELDSQPYAPFLASSPFLDGYLHMRRREEAIYRAAQPGTPLPQAASTGQTLVHTLSSGEMARQAEYRAFRFGHEHHLYSNLFQGTSAEFEGNGDSMVSPEELDLWLRDFTYFVLQNGGASSSSSRLFSPAGISTPRQHYWADPGGISDDGQDPAWIHLPDSDGRSRPDERLFTGRRTNPGKFAYGKKRKNVSENSSSLRPETPVRTRVFRILVLVALMGMAFMFWKGKMG